MRATFSVTTNSSSNSRGDWQVQRLAWKQDLIAKLHSDFEAIVQHEADSGVEFWWARELQELLAYSQWRNFEPVVEKAISSCETAGHDPRDH